MPNLAVACAVTLLIGSSISAQEFDDRSFSPDEYNAEIFVDFERLHETGAWDAVERSVLRPMLGMFRRKMGFDLGELDRMRVAIQHTMAGGLHESREAWVFAGTDQVGLDDFEMSGFVGFTRAKIGRHEVLTDGEGDTWFSPRGGLLVFGGEGVLEEVLREQRRGGVADPELMSITAGPKPVAYLAGLMPVSMEDEDLPRNFMAPIPDTWFDAEDRPTAIAVRFYEDPETGNILGSLLLRFTNGEHGPALFEESFREWLESVGSAPPYGAFTKLLDGLEFERDGRDVVASLDLGAPSVAIGTFIQLAVLAVPFSFDSPQEVEVIEVVQDEQIPDPPPPDKKR